MANPSPSVRSNEIAFNSAILVSMGCNATAWSTGAVEALSRAMHGPLTVERAILVVRVMPTSAAATISVGNAESATAKLDGYNCQNLEAGVYDITNDAAWVSKSFTMGELMTITLGAATAVGSAALELVLRPGV